jgi:SAM-dependent methyltransferase
VEKFPVRLTTLDTVHRGGESIGFIKIDAEGGEVDILKGAQKTLRRFRPVISVEYGYFAYSAFGHDAWSLRKIAESLGYLVYDIFGYCIHDKELYPQCVNSYYWDYLLVPKLDFAVQKLLHDHRLQVIEKFIAPVLEIKAAEAPQISSRSAENPFTHGHCPVCDSAYLIKIRDVGAARTQKAIPLYFCMHCRSLSCDSGYTDNHLGLLDDVSYYLKNLEPSRGAFLGLAEFISNEAITILGKKSGEITHADVGCKLGVLVDAMVKKGFVSVGYDPNIYAIRKGRELSPGLRLEEGMPDGKTHYDFITIIDLLGHIAKPGELLKSIAANLNPGGLLYISVPRLEENDWKYLAEPLEDQLKSLEGSSPFRDNDVNITRCSTAGLLEIMGKSGLVLAQDNASAQWPANGLLFQKK